MKEEGNQEQRAGREGRADKCLSEQASHAVGRVHGHDSMSWRLSRGPASVLSGNVLAGADAAQSLPYVMRMR